MGAFACCPLGDSGNDTTPDPEERRKQMAEAADRRQAQADSRGVKDPEKLKRQQKQREELEKTQAMQPNDGGGNLKWNVG
ncbi:small VCP/p97-interacting protein-like [Styela clava]